MLLPLALCLAVVVCPGQAFRGDEQGHEWGNYRPRFRDDNDYNGRVSLSASVNMLLTLLSRCPA
jgi:hypothetical protein